ncbi:MAG: hypothetical protein ACE5G1_03120 [bacterium]
MPMSLRLERELEKKIIQAAKRLNVNKTEIIRRSLKKYLSELAENTEPNVSYAIYQTFEEKIPGSGHGSLSVHHREEVLKRLQKQKAS